MTYTLELSSQAQSYLRRQTPGAQRRIGRRLDQLCDDPYDASISKVLEGRGGQRFVAGR